MAFRFRKSFKIFPGVRINLNKSGTSISLGGRGITTNISKRGVKTTIGIRGTGISYTHNHIKSSAQKAATFNATALPIRKNVSDQRRGTPSWLKWTLGKLCFNRFELH